VGTRGGIQLSFILLEPVMYLQGDEKSGRHFKSRPAVSRGYLLLKVTQMAKIKSIRVSFHGLTRFQSLGEGTKRQDLITTGITYFEDGRITFSDRGCYGLCADPIAAKESGQHVKSSARTLQEEEISPPEYDPGSLGQSGLPGAGSESPQCTINSHRKGDYGIFPAGDYFYPFEFLVHNSLPETISTELISIRYYLEAKVELPGIFRSNMCSQLDIPLLRLPSESSLELIEPIIISKEWRERLHYNACILGKSFCLGSRVPIRLKLIPFVGLICCRIKVYVSQHMQYRKVGREGRLLQLGSRKVLLFEKEAGIECKSTYPGGGIRITANRDIMPSADMQTPSLLGDILETCEIQLQVQLPRCHELKETPQWQRLQASSKTGKPDVNHWIHIVLCLSETDKDETARRKQNTLQLLIIKTPITVLSCRAIPSNIYVPPYPVESNNKALSMPNSECNCVSGDSPKTLVPIHEAEVPEFEESASIESTLPDKITRPLSFESASEDLKPPAPAHIARWRLPKYFSRVMRNGQAIL